MHPDRNQPRSPGTGNSTFVWLLCALAPSAIGVICLGIKTVGPNLALFLMVINVFCSYAGASGLLSKSVSDPIFRFVLIACLGTFFLVLNFIIAVFVGCSQSSGF